MASATADFERIYRRHARDVYRFALSVVRNPLEAEDVTQTTFLNAYRALERGDRPDRPRSWLLAIAHNAIRSRDRWRLRRPPEVPLDVAEYRLAAQADDPPAVDELLHALGELPEAQREAIARRELQGQTYPEIAAVLGISVSAVESLIARARRALRAQRERLAGIAILRRLCEQGDGGLVGAAPKAAVVVAAATALVGGMAAESRVAGSPPALAGTTTTQPAPPQTAHVQSAAVPTAHPASRASAPDAVTPAAGTPTAPAGASPSTTASTAAASTSAAAAAPAPAAATTSAAAQPVTSTAAAATAAAGATATAVLSAPTATAPPATVPAVTTPLVTTPPVTTPPVTTPELPMPTVTPPPPPTLPGT